MKANQHGTGTYGYYQRQLAQRRTTLNEDAKGDLMTVLRGAVHYYGELVRSLSGLPSGSPELLKAQSIFKSFVIAKEKLENTDEKVVIDELTSDIAKFEASDYLDGVASKIALIADQIPIPEPEPAPVAAAPEPAPPGDEPAPEESTEEPTGEPGPADGHDFGVSEAPEAPAADEVSDEEFKELVANLST